MTALSLKELCEAFLTVESLILLPVNLRPYLKLSSSTQDEADIFNIRYFVKRF